MTDFDPTGLDVAHQIAAAARGARVNPNRPAKTKRSKGDLEPIGEILNDVVDEQGWTTQIGIQQLLARWSDLVGAVNAAHSKPETYANRILTIRAESSTWASSLRQLAPQIVAALNEKLGQGAVERVNVIGPTAPSWKHGKRSVPGRGPRDTYG